MKLKDAPCKESWDKPRHGIKKQRHHFANKGPHSQSYGFPSSHVWMWESRTIKEAECWRIDVFELWCWRRLLRVPLTARRSSQSILKDGIQPWVFFGRNDAKADTPTLWPPNVKNWLIEKDHDAGKDWRQEEKEMTEQEMGGWHHWPEEHEFKQTLGVGEGHGSLACCSPRGHKESETSEWLNWTERK